MTTRSKTALVALLAVLAGCAADRTREAETAGVTVTSDTQEVRPRPAPAPTTGTQVPIELTFVSSADGGAPAPAAAGEGAKAEPAEGAKDERAGGAEPRGTNLGAGPKLDQKQALAERNMLQTMARERISRAEARAWEARNKLARVAGDRRYRFNRNVNTYHAKKSEVEGRIAGLLGAANTDWRGATERLERSLQELELSAERLNWDM